MVCRLTGAAPSTKRQACAASCRRTALEIDGDLKFNQEPGTALAQPAGAAFAGVPGRPPYNRPLAFVHLRTHTEFSVVDGTLRIDEVAAAARADGQLALGVTDLSNLFGAIKFYKACRGKGVKPLVGVDVWMDPLPDAADRVPTRLALLVQNTQGYLHLCELLGRSWTKNVQRAQAWVRWDWLEELAGGMIALSGADMGAVGQSLLGGDAERAEAAA